ncbi:dipeptidase [Flammeovirga yaeyamensis]|uniref:Dipeptidase n=1 Tax=Flammeovirga yaeyamensis TaxID=367791 RepID=A0AAX1NFH4_9BACT|nr:membrane dipeptidase [Flammeovirga yaeyamensis]MBB3696728.1 membrane dipeptidase [Flammeovirga yaeyamensis]NMF33398.1 dipeptidase [Flammeovirga yaeyamensis]QWG05328.1 dipeptidase [Flammeovirga yaeyamensis]
MKKYTLLPLLCGLFVLFTSSSPLSDRAKTWKASDKAKKFVKETISLDFYASPYGVGWNKPEHLHDYIDRAMETGITGASATLAATYFTWEDWIKEYNVWRSTMLQTPDKFVFVHHVEDIHRAHKEGKYAMIFNSQTTSILNGDLTKIAALRGMGVSSMQLVYNGAYRTGDGVMRYYKGKDGGLTDWGKKVLDEMVKQGIIVDLSHTGRNTAVDISNYMLEKYPGVPFVYTHSLPEGLYKNLPDATERGCCRNITDEQAKLAAKSGGVVSPTFTEWMMDGVWPDDISPVHCADMIDYYVKLIGEDHVGIATDDMFTLDILMGFVKQNAASYDDDGYMVNAFNKGADGCGELAKILPAVTDELWKRGYTDEQIKKIYGGNVMRVYKKVWK